MLTNWSLWLVIGFTGQGIFTARFLVQWVASERKRDSVMPVAFWWLSLFGGTILLSYAVHKRDPVIIVGQSMGLWVYARNLMLVAKKRCRAVRREARKAAIGAAEEAGSGAIPPPKSHLHNHRFDSSHVVRSVPIAK